MTEIFFAGNMAGLGYKFMVEGTPQPYELCAPIDATRFVSSDALITFVKALALPPDFYFNVASFYVTT
jgi:hypothetical protein